MGRLKKMKTIFKLNIYKKHFNEQKKKEKKTTRISIVKNIYIPGMISFKLRLKLFFIFNFEKERRKYTTRKNQITVDGNFRLFFWCGRIDTNTFEYAEKRVIIIEIYSHNQLQGCQVFFQFHTTSSSSSSYSLYSSPCLNIYNKM